MKRREFFKFGAHKTAKLAFGLAGEAAARRARNWFRPPFAVNELDFLLDCTRCDKCIEACPHQVLFALPASHGLQAAATPAMDLLVRGCQLCPDWPCVTACEPGVLKLPDPEHDPDSDQDPDQAQPTPPDVARLARVEINTRTCLPYQGPDCGACAHACPVPGALEWVGGTKPVINLDICTGCALCRQACITEPKSIDVTPLIANHEAPAKVP